MFGRFHLSRKIFAAIACFFAVAGSCDKPAPGVEEPVASETRAEFKVGNSGEHPVAQRKLPYPQVTDTGPVARALNRAVGYFSGREIVGDSGFLVLQASQILGGEFPAWAGAIPVDPALKTSDSVIARFYQMGNAPLAKLPSLDPPVGVAPVESGGAPSTQERVEILKIMTTAMMCKGSPAGSRSGELFSEPAQGYLLTHQTLGLYLMHSQGCVDAIPELGRLLVRLYGEFLGDETVTDLSIERMAFLCMLGQCDWVPEQRITALLSYQNDGGGWTVLPGDAPHPEEHTVALAFYLLASRLRMN